MSSCKAFFWLLLQFPLQAPVSWATMRWTVFCSQGREVVVCRSVVPLIPPHLSAYIPVLNLDKMTVFDSTVAVRACQVDLGM